MPYIAIKAYKKDEKIKQEVVDRINKTFLELWGCPQEAISISIEEYTPAEFDAEVQKKIIDPNASKMMICSGKKNY
ncbi:MAG: tautomerase family protein [Spirochaetia bacterium]|nr:tautomerase family protein [Spirochaetia bacterium]